MFVKTTDLFETTIERQTQHNAIHHKVILQNYHLFHSIPHSLVNQHFWHYQQVEKKSGETKRIWETE